MDEVKTIDFENYIKDTEEQRLRTRRQGTAKLALEPVSSRALRCSLKSSAKSLSRV